MTDTRKDRKKRKKKARASGILLIILLITMIAVIAAFGYNIYQISNKSTASSDELETTVSNEYTNDYYTIGYNATSVNKEYFLELNDAVDSGDTVSIASSLVKVFITEYYTWTNKDGNYDIGGIQYIYTDQQSSFEDYTRNEYYVDMDLYIAQQGSENLMQVAGVEITSAAATDDYTVLNASSESVTYPCVLVTATWTYEEDTTMDLSSAQTSGTFYVINHDGRMEIAAIQ